MKLRARLGLRSSYVGRSRIGLRRPRACGRCGIAGHNVARCDVDARLCEIWEAEERAAARVKVPKGMCSQCHRRPKQVRLMWAGGSTSWACRECAELLRAIAGAKTGTTPAYEPIPALEVVK